jgi:hypothetical protein
MDLIHQFDQYWIKDGIDGTKTIKIRNAETPVFDDKGERLVVNGQTVWTPRVEFSLDINIPFVSKEEAIKSLVNIINCIKEK